MHTTRKLKYMIYFILICCFLRVIFESMRLLFEIILYVKEIRSDSLMVKRLPCKHQISVRF